MPRNGSGAYSLPESAFVPGTTISSAAVNSDLSDIALALTGSIAADGQTPITGPITFSDGTSTSPGLTFNSDTGTGIYRPGASQLGFTLGSVAAYLMTAGVLSPSTSDAAALGSGTLMWADLFLASGGVINWNNGDVTITHSANSLTFANASSGYFFDNSLLISTGGLTVTAGSVNLPAGSVAVAALNTAIFATQAQQEAGSATNAATTPGRQQFHPSAAKAWAQVQISGGVATLLAGYNIASILRNGLGDVTLTYTTAMSSANYCAIAQFYGIDGSAQAGPAGNVKSQTASAARVQMLVATNSTNTTSIAQDLSFMFVAYGDQ